ncbi:CoA-binding protein [Myxococcota bacterium]|nr:CoA-binding protein [Myxococcota bacterium]
MTQTVVERARSEDIAAFLRERRIAFIGVSRDPKDFSRVVMKTLVDHGYDVVPVNPSGAPIDGRETHTSIATVPGPIGGALVMTPAASSAAVVEQCLASGVPKIWLHRGAGVGSVSDEAVARCRAAGVPVVAGECPLMFLEGERVHAVHAAMRRLGGDYPAAAMPAAKRASAEGHALTFVLVALHLFVAAGALFGGGALVIDPSGHSLGFPDAVREALPFPSFFVPGVVLLVAVGGSSLAAAISTTRRARIAPKLSLLAGVTLTGWMIVQLALVPGLAAIQLVYVALGLAMVALATVRALAATPRLVVLGPAAT